MFFVWSSYDSSPEKNSDINFAMDLKTVLIIKSSSVYVEYKTPLITMELTSGFFRGSDSAGEN